MILLLPQGPALTGIDLRNAIADVETALNAAGAGDLVEWAESDLYEWFDEAAKRLARSFGVFVERDASTAIVLDTPSYTLPARHLSTIHASVGPSSGGKALYPVNVQELEGLDADWIETTGPTNTFLMDTAGMTAARLYPAPDVTITGFLALIMHRFPATISSSAYTLSAPAAIRDYFTWYALAEARGRQSDAQMPEVAEHFAKRVGLMEKVIESYWGTAQ
jgi:hypothetical protein